MEARATPQTQSSTRALIVFIAAVVAALLVGGAGGYTARAVTYSTTTTTPTTVVHRPFVVEQAPYSSPSPSALPQPIYDPKGNSVPY